MSLLLAFDLKSSFRMVLINKIMDIICSCNEYGGSSSETSGTASPGMQTTFSINIQIFPKDGFCFVLQNKILDLRYVILQTFEED